MPRPHLVSDDRESHAPHSSGRSTRAPGPLSLAAEARAIERRLLDLKARLAEIDAETRPAGQRPSGSWN